MWEIMSLLFNDPTVTVVIFDHAQSNNRKRPKKIKLPEINFILNKQLIKFSSTYWPLSFCKILKNFFEPIQSYEDVPFSGPKYPNLSWTNFFWYKPLLILSSTYWPFSLGKILKKSYSESKVKRMHHFCTQNGPFAPNKIFFEKNH